MKRGQKIAKRIVIGILVFIVLVIIIFTGLFFNKIRTGLSLRKISKAYAFEVRVHGNYYFDDYLKQGATTANELEDFLMGKLTFGLKDKLHVEHGCSSFYAQTPDGDYILALDLDNQNRDKCTPLVTITKNKKRVIGVSNMRGLLNRDDDITLLERLYSFVAPYILANGVNEYGLAATLATAYGSADVKDPDKISLYGATVIAAILDNAKTVDEAIEFISQYNIVAKDYSLEHYMIGDASGNSVVLELTFDGMQMIQPDTNYQVMSNFVLYQNPNHKGFGSNRYHAYDDVLSKSNGIITEDDAMELLKKNTIPGHENYSVVYNLTKKTAKICFYNDYETAYSYDFNS